MLRKSGYSVFSGECCLLLALQPITGPVVQFTVAAAVPKAIGAAALMRLFTTIVCMPFSIAMYDDFKRCRLLWACL